MLKKEENPEWSKDPSARSQQSKRRQTWLNMANQAEILDIALNVGWIDKMVLDQLIVKATEEGWLVMVKAHRNGRNRVAYCSGATFSEALELAANWAATGVLSWVPDRWPPKILRKRKP